MDEFSDDDNGVIETLESDSSTDSKSRKNVKVNGEARDSDVREKLTGTANEDDDDTEDSKREERKEWKRNDSEEESSQQRHSNPEFESHQSRPLSEANSDLSYDLLSEKPFKSTNDIGPNQLGDNSSDEVKRSSINSNDSTGTDRCLVSGSRRNLPKHQRPLTRYLPIFSADLDLRQHIESAGHQITLCPHVIVDSTSCRGYLHKLGATFHGWSRRWFVLDRQKNAFIYYSDKSERKPRGGAYFSTIDEVYLDHLNTSKSGRPHCTFIVKTKKRSYHLQAASDAAARIWIDAIITGAQGNIDY